MSQWVKIVMTGVAAVLGVVSLVKAVVGVLG